MCVYVYTMTNVTVYLECDDVWGEIEQLFHDDGLPIVPGQGPRGAVAILLSRGILIT